MPPKAQPASKAMATSDTVDADFSAVVATVPIEGQPDLIVGQHFTELAKRLKFNMADPKDITLYALAWKFNCQTPLSISRKEWVDGFRAIRCTGIDKAADIVGCFAAETVPEENFKQFYFFVYGWCRENSQQKYIALETAEALWPALFQHHTFAHLAPFIAFLKEKKHNAVSKDEWKQMLPFAKADFKTWKFAEQDGSWPSIMDDYVRTLQKK